MLQGFIISKYDIPYKTVLAAYHNSSFTPEKRAESDRQGYVEFMQSVKDEFSKWVNESNEREMADDLNRFKAGYLKRKLKILNTRSGITSQMITGAGGWTASMVRTHQKRVNREGEQINELIEFKSKVLTKLRRKYDPKLIARAPIRSDDDNALERLQKKLSNLEKFHHAMKEGNKIVRSKPKNERTDEKIEKLIDLGLKPENAEKAFIADFGQYGFPSYALQNNNAEIRRLKERIKALENQPTETVETKKNGVRIIKNAELMRLQLIFPGKPSAEVRKVLKSHGFKWAPSQRAWQRLLNNAASAAAEEILAQI